MSINGYNGNPNLPRAGSQKSWDPHRVAEFTKCMEDPIYFAETYFKIVHPDHGLIPFKLHDFQREAIEAFQCTRKLILNTSRQVGKTTFATAVILHFALFSTTKPLIALLANKADTAREILSRIQLAYEYLPDWLKGGVKEWNKGSVIFENGAKIIAAASSSSAIRGKSVALLYIDECAFVEHWDEFSASVLPTLSSGVTTKMIFTSTPNGLNHFYYYCEGAKQNTNGFTYIEVPWYKVPGRDEAWKKEVLEGINHDMEKFVCEYECEFMGSSGTLITGACLKTLKPSIPLDFRDGFKQYERPVKNHTYVTVVDVSRGKGLDFSAFQIIDVTDSTFKQVATYRNNLVTPTDYTSVVYNMSKTYNDAYVLVEINDIGGQVADMLYNEYEYENILHTDNHGRGGKRVSGGFGTSVDRGIRTTKTVKALGCSILKLLVEQKRLSLVDKETITELSVFSKKGTSYEAEPGYHDDTVMCLVLFSWLTADPFFKDITNIDMMRLLRDRTEEEIAADLVPFGLVQDGIEDLADEPFVSGDHQWWKSSSW